MISRLDRRFFVMLIFFAAVLAPVRAQNTLETAASAILNGDYDAAIASYTAATSDPALQCDALFGLATAYVRIQSLTEADAALTQHLSACGPLPRTLIMRGHIREQMGQTAEALADYQQSVTLTPNPLESYVYERMAALDSDNGVRSMRLAAGAERAPEGEFTLRQKLADVYLLLGNSSLALAEYNAILADMNAYITTLAALDVKYDEDGARRAELEFKAANLEIGAEQFDQGYARLQRIIGTYTETSFAFDALVQLVTAGQDVDLLTRTRINILNENYGPILGVVPDYLTTAENPPAELYLLVGIAQRGLGDVETALETLDKVQTLFPQDPIASRAALEIAQTYAAAEQYDQAITAYQDVATTYPSSPEAPDALLKAAQMAETVDDDLERAAMLYDQLGTKYPTSDQAKAGLLDIGLRLITSNPAQAATFLGRANTPESLLWQGKVLQLTDVTAAQAAWTQAAALEPGSYFSMRACTLINTFDPFALSGSIQPMTLTPEDKTAAAQWVAQTFNLPGVSADLSPELANDPLLLRGVELWRVGFWTEARLELDTLHRLHRNDAAGLLQLAFYYEEIGLYRSSLFAALRLINLTDVPLTSIPAGLARLAYPIYYEELVIQESQANGLDPLLVAGLIRQESSFDATNVSAANARGLMQLIPVTAADVAQQKAWPNYTVKDLFRPQVNIAFGSYYLASVRDFQNGSIIGALLSYNAGPTAAQAWLNSAAGDLDRLHQVIEYDETRLYQEFLYQNAIIYQQLYRSTVPSCMFGRA